MPHDIYFEDIEVGQQIPAFERETNFMNWNRYAAVNDEFVYLHMDDAVAKAAGQSEAFGMGNLRWAYVMNALQNWVGDESEVRELSMQFRAINRKHEVLTTQVTVTDKQIEDGEHRVLLDVNVVNQDGVAGAPGKAVVVVPSRAG